MFAFMNACVSMSAVQLPLLYKATSNDESPVTGPMLTDITSKPLIGHVLWIHASTGQLVSRLDQSWLSLLIRVLHLWLGSVCAVSIASIAWFSGNIPSFLALVIAELPIAPLVAGHRSSLNMCKVGLEINMVDYHLLLQLFHPESLLFGSRFVMLKIMISFLSPNQMSSLLLFIHFFSRTEMAFESWSNQNFLQDFLLDKLSSPGCFSRAKVSSCTSVLK